ncbi:hypothetical protein ACWF95_41750 [Streptomyces vinaceus]
MKAVADRVVELATMGVDPTELGEETVGTFRHHRLLCGGWFETQALHRSRPRRLLIVQIMPPFTFSNDLVRGWRDEVFSRWVAWLIMFVWRAVREWGRGESSVGEGSGYGSEVVGQGFAAAVVQCECSPVLKVCDSVLDGDSGG